MMRSLYSGVSGLKVHQTKMDVIGNNIANVNTVGFKGSTVNFSDILYQTSRNATGANAETGSAGKNAIQVGLGANLSSITTNISTAGGSQRTDNPYDCMITGEGFYVVNSGGTNYFTKSGAFGVDGAGTLCAANGASVMGWQVDKEGNIVKAQVSALRVMSPETEFIQPEATKNATVTGNIAPTDPNLDPTKIGATAQFDFYDQMGNSYMAKIKIIKNVPDVAGEYTVEVTDILDSNNMSIFAKKKADGTYENSGTKVKLGGMEFGATAGTGTPAIPDIDPKTGKANVVGTGTKVVLKFDATNGKFTSVDGAVTPTNDRKAVNLSITPGAGIANSFSDISVDFSTMNQFGETSNSSKVEAKKGAVDGITGRGIDAGKKIGLKIDGSGVIFGVYDNGMEKVLGQIALATFSNPSGLEAVGNNMFAQTQNSGDFDGVGQDPSYGGGITTGVLEMSNVDLSTEFTNMITTQRGFQANSRIITTSDTLLEELINLKR